MKHFLLIAISILVGVQSHSQNAQQLIPVPQQVRYQAGKFLLNNLSVFTDKSYDEQVIFAVNDFIAHIEKRLSVTVKKASSAATATLQFKVLQKGYELPEYNFTDTGNKRESYTIKITTGKIYIEAFAATGLYYALQTLKQMPELNGKAAYFPLAEIVDEPTLKYRGVMMDFAHGGLLKVDEVKRQIEFLAKWKTNQYYFYNEVSIQLKDYA